MRPILQQGVPVTGDAIPSVVAGAMIDYPTYEDAVLNRLWGWADRHHRGELDGGGRIRRPPVLRRKLASKSVLVPRDPAKAAVIVSAIPNKERHQWFRSFRSSQALAQSVFGAVSAFGRLDMLEGISADCGRPAFLQDVRSASLVLEHQVRCLGEPRRTSVDVLLAAGSGRVAVECKFMECEFGVCSRPKLRPNDRNWAKQHCDGHYRFQRGRRTRCALTEIGVRYWNYLPHLFSWAADHDLRPCPLSETYQLARNALAATVTSAGVDRNSGHVLIIYDARNPEYAAAGTAHRQYEAAIAASRVPGLIRRLSWQRLAGELTRAHQLAYLVSGLAGKYGTRPE